MSSSPAPSPLDAQWRSAEAQEKQAVRDFFQNKTDGYFVEVGANDPDSFESQTHHLEQAGWRGLLVEPIPRLAAKARAVRPRSVVCEAACTSPDQVGEVEFLIPLVGAQQVTGHASLKANIDEHNYEHFEKLRVKARTLTSLLDEQGTPPVDFLSIDVEGAELEVLQGLDLARYRPRLILLEDKHLYLTKHRHLRRNGYVLVQRVNRNCWYVPEGVPAPQPTRGARLRLWKRMYISLWVRKLQYALRHKTLAPFRTL